MGHPDPHLPLELRTYDALGIARMLHKVSDDPTPEESANARETVHRLIRECGLRPVDGIRPYVVTGAELARWMQARTESFVPRKRDSTAPLSPTHNENPQSGTVSSDPRGKCNGGATDQPQERSR